MARTQTSREKWIEQGLQAMAEAGPAAVKVDVLAQELGVTRGGFYGHFSGRQAFMEEMLDTWEREVTDAVINLIESDASHPDARSKLRSLFTVAMEDDSPFTWAAELAIRVWARHDSGVAQRVRRVDGKHVEYLRSLFTEFCADEAEVEARCVLAMSLRVGNPLVSADSTDHRDDVMDRALNLLLS